MYLYQDLNRCPSTIDGYRTAIVDTLGLTGLHISQSSDLNRLLSSFHREHPKSSRNLPKWNLCVVLNELTKAPFDPMKDTDLKHLTLKTAFLLALASGKCRREIHAWVANKVWNLLQWEKVGVIAGPNHASVSLESSQHIYKFLPKRPYLVRQRQQYVSGTSSSGTSPRPFPSAYSSSGRKEEGGGAHPLQPSLQESIPGSRYWLPLQMLWVTSLIFLTVMYLVFISVP